MFAKKNNERGSITIEATISLSAFMFAIVTLLTIVNICIVQYKVGVALHAAAKELSQYTYLYSLTGLANSHAKISGAAQQTSEDISKTIETTDKVFTNIQNLGDGLDAPLSSGQMAAAVANVKSVKEAGVDAYTNIENLASDPKSLAFGIVKMLGNDLMNEAMSKMVAAPLAKALCKKNLVSSPGDNVDRYLKSLGVKPDAGGNYFDSLDFSDSYLFPNGSNEIRLSVSYDVKVIALLPIDFSFHFHQQAITHGWLCGEQSFVSGKTLMDNKNIWNNLSIHERSEVIRNDIMEELKKQGYYNTKNLTDVPLYNPDTNQFVAINSLNPLYSADGEGTKTLDDISDEAIRIQLQQYRGMIESSVNGKTQIDYKDKDGTVKTKDCTDASTKIVLVIPEDPGLEERVNKIISEMGESGVEFEVQKKYGNGARQTEVDNGSKN